MRTNPIQRFMMHDFIFIDSSREVLALVLLTKFVSRCLQIDIGEVHCLEIHAECIFLRMEFYFLKERHCQCHRKNSIQIVYSDDKK